MGGTEKLTQEQRKRESGRQGGGVKAKRQELTRRRDRGGRKEAESTGRGNRVGIRSRKGGRRRVLEKKEEGRRRRKEDK